MGTVVITGGNKGLGLAQTRCLLSRGWTVHVVARTRGDLGTLDGNHEASGRLVFQPHDLSDWRDTSWLEGIGGVDALVNNAGMHLKKPVWEVEPDELDLVLDLNVKAVFAACAAFVRLSGTGSTENRAIVNVSSMAGLMGLSSAAAYVTSKTALIGLTRSVAVDGAERGVRCNAVCPGFIDTDMTRAVLAADPERRARIDRRLPGGRWGSPDDVAEAIAWLLSAEARYINGVALPVDGGYAVGM